MPRRILLASLTSLTYLDLKGNRISDIAPLLESSGLGAGDEVNLGENYLDLSDLENIKQLEARGVTIYPYYR